MTEYMRRRVEDALRFIGSYVGSHGWAPSVREIADGLDVSPAIAKGYVDRLVELGWVVRGRNPRELRVVRDSPMVECERTRRRSSEGACGSPRAVSEGATMNPFVNEWLDVVEPVPASDEPVPEYVAEHVCAVTVSTCPHCRREFEHAAIRPERCPRCGSRLWWGAGR